MWAFASNDVWIGAVGGATYQYDGTSWTSRPGPTTDVDWLWGAAANDLWKVGQICDVRRWNGTMWTTVTVPNCQGAEIFAVGGA